jgi:hypothetical protein
VTPGSTRLTDRDQQLLSFLAEHRLVLDTQVQALLGTSLDATRTRLSKLDRAGFLTHRHVFNGEPGCCQIKRPGLNAIGSSLQAPNWNLGTYAHDVGLAWLWLSAHAGVFGPVREVIAERTLRSRDGARLRSPDGARDPGELPSGVHLGGVGPRGRERIHYPDLLLVTPQGDRVALEFELTGKGRARREGILGGYAADDRIDAVVYLVEQPPLRRAIEESARRMGVSELVQVRYFYWGEGNRSEQSLAQGRERLSGASRPASVGRPGSGRRAAGGERSASANGSRQPASAKGSRQPASAPRPRRAARASAAEVAR